MARESFVHLHVHSDMSQLDGCARIADYVKAAAERGNPALALTDHGTMRGAFALTEECDKKGIKPVYGVELYACEDASRRGLTDEEKAAATAGVDNKTKQRELVKAAEERLGVRKLYHLTAWALDNDGLRNLYRLTSEAWSDGFYYKPRVDLAMLERHSAGVAIGTGCVQSLVYRHAVEERPRLADSMLGKLDEIFAERLFLEVMPHDLAEQRVANEFALSVRLAGKHRLIATQDAHYMGKGDAAHHDVLLAIETHKPLGDPDRFRFSGDGYWLKTSGEMADSFEHLHPYMARTHVDEAIASTVELAQQCKARIDIDPLRCLLPPVDVPDGFKDEFAYLVHLATRGMARRKIDERAKRLAEREGIGFRDALRVYSDRAKRELAALKRAGFAPYFIIIRDMYEWVRERGIARGPGRGSAAGSLVSYLLGITDVDPIEHRLMFERFIAPGRINMPDIDCDFEDARRGEVVEHLRQKYGEDRVAQISTIGRMNGRQALKDVARAYEVPFQRANVAAGVLPAEAADSAIEEALQRSEFFRGFRDEYPEVVEHATALEGMAKTMGVHAAGVVTSPVPLADLVPVETRRAGHRQQVVTAFDMRGVEGIGLLKIDVLGLKGITVLADAERAVSKAISPSGVAPFSLHDVPLDDEETLAGFTERDFVGVFQFDTPSSHSVCDGLEFKTFDDLAVVNAINRPGALAFADEFKKRRSGQSAARKHMFHPRVSEITADALGLVVYQEHIIKIATDVAGLTPEAADKLRKKIGKKEGAEALEKDRHKFVEGCRRKTPDMGRDAAERLFDSIVKFGRYGFNRSHAVCYSLLAYWMMWLKKHRPLEFYWALMRRESDSKKVQRFSRDAKEHGVETKLPDVNVSGDGFTIDYDANAVRGSLLEIKGVGEVAVSEIVRLREEGGPYKDAIDFLERARGKKVTKRTVDALARAGALDGLIPNPRWFVSRLDSLWKDIERGKMDPVRMAIEGSARSWQWDEEQRLVVASEVDPLADPPHPLIKWEGWLSRHVKVPLREISDELMTEERNVYVAGVVTEAEERCVGDTKAIDEFPDEETQRVIGWGKKWVRLTVEGLEGGRSWVKIDWSLVEEFRPVVDRGAGALVLVCARTRPDWHNLDAHFVADVEAMADKLERDPSELTTWERLFVEEHHPATTYPWESKADRRLALRDPADLAARASGRFSVIGVVSHLFLRTDKRGKEMAFFGVAGLRGYLNVLCFSSSWDQFRAHLKLGTFARLKLSKLDERGACSLEAARGAIHLFGKG